MRRFGRPFRGALPPGLAEDFRETQATQDIVMDAGVSVNIKL
jgi:hypothetical protein